MKNTIMLFYLFLIFVVTHGQLSIDELFHFNSKYTSSGNCTNFQYNFSSLRIHSNRYDQISLDCQSSNLILENQEKTFSSICPTDQEYFRTIRIHLNHLIRTSIQVNQLHLHGIELCSLDDLIRNVYHEYSYYRSRWALLINLNTENQQQHIAIATNGEMTFMLFLQSSEYNTTLLDNKIQLIFPSEQIFQFNQSKTNIWRIDQSYIRNPKSMEYTTNYQISKTKFTLFSNETFVIYGTQASLLRRFLVYIDETLVSCKYDYIIQCIFPILPLHIRDTHEPVLKVLYSRIEVFNTTLKLLPRTRLHHIPTNHSLTEIETFEVNIDGNLCKNESLKSSFTFIVHLWKEDMKGIARYSKAEKNDLPPFACNTTVKIGEEIGKLLNPLLIDDIISMDVDLIHEWYDHQNCRAEKTRISFI
ncbi:hypothetical protein I4U23_018113 [Adineta vaga]|nr:hypothetical protein I4U23_018113 [Adineta vaga]